MEWTKKVLWRWRIRQLVRLQLRTRVPLNVSIAYERLRGTGLSDRDARRMLAAALECETVSMITECRPFDRVEFGRLLDSLPAGTLRTFDEDFSFPKLSQARPHGDSG